MPDWIKMRANLTTDPRVLAMADSLSETARDYVLKKEARDLLGVTPPVTRDVMRDVVIASLHRIWACANEHTTDGVFRHCSLDYLDSISFVPGFGAAMAAAGWAVFDAESRSITLPNFLEYNAPSKAKADSHSERQKRYRERKKQKSAHPNNTSPETKGDVTHDVTASSLLLSNLSLSTSEEDLKNQINALRPKTWGKLTDWSAEDVRELLSARRNIHALTSQDWLILAWFCAEVDSAANGNRTTPELKLTAKRGLFCAEIASILTRATAHWEQSGRPRLTPKPAAIDPTKKATAGEPEPPPLDPGSFLGLLRTTAAPSTPTT